MGDWTTNSFIYKPALGASGSGEKTSFDQGLEYVDTRLAKELWVGDPITGDTDTDWESLKTAVTYLDGLGGGTLHVPPGTYTVAGGDSPYTVPATVTVMPEVGASFAVGNGLVLNFAGGFYAPSKQFFAITGTGYITVPAYQRIDVHWFGATGDGSTNDATAINAAAVSARACTAKAIEFPSASGYVFESQLDLRGLHIYAGPTTLKSKYEANSNVLIGGADTSTPLYNPQINLKVIVKSDYGSPAGTIWTAGTIGIKIQNMRQMNNVFLSATGFETGIKVDETTGSGYTAYGHIFLGSMTNNKLGLDVQTNPSGGTRWSNQVEWIGGDFSSSIASATAAAQFKSNAAAGGNQIDSHIMVGPSFQMGDTSTVNGVIYDNCLGCFVVRPRIEHSASTDKVVMQASNQSINCGVIDIVGQELFKSGSIYTFHLLDTTANCKDLQISYAGDVLRNCHPLGKTNFTDAWNDGTYTYTPGFSILQLDGTYTVPTSWLERVATAGCAVADDTYTNTYITPAAGYGVGFWIQFDDVRKQLNVKARTAGYIYFTCYDSSNNLLEYSTTMHVNGPKIAWDAGSKSYRCQYGRGTFTFINAVKRVFVSVGNNGATYDLHVYAPVRTSCWVGNGALGDSAACIIKATTGDPSTGFQGQLCDNTFDDILKIYSNGAWKQVVNFSP